MEILVSAMAVLVALSCLVALIYTELLSKDDNERESETTDDQSVTST